MYIISSFPKMAILDKNWAALKELWVRCHHQYEQCLNLHLFYRDSEQVDNWMSRQEVTEGVQQVSRNHFFTPHLSPFLYSSFMTTTNTLTNTSEVLSLSQELESELQKEESSYNSFMDKCIEKIPKYIEEGFQPQMNIRKN